MDELFGENNRLACAPWLSEASGGKEKTGLRTGHEYIVIYVKNDSSSIEPYRVCRRVNILRDYPDDKIKIYP